MASSEEIVAGSTAVGFDDASEFLQLFQRIKEENQEIEAQIQVMRPKVADLIEQTNFADDNDYQNRKLEILQEKDKLHKKKDDLMSQKNSMQGQIDMYTIKLKKYNDDIDQLKEECGALQANNNEIMEKVAILRDEVDKSLVQMENLLSQKQKLEIEIETYKRQIETNQEVIQSRYPEKLLPKFDRFKTKKQAHQKGVVGICFAPDASTLYTVGEDKVLSMWAADDLTLLKSINLPAVHTGISIQPEGNFICLSGSDKVVRIFDTKTFRITTELRNHTGECTSSVWCSKSNILSASKDRTVKMFDLSSNSVVYTAMAATSVNSICKTDDPTVYAIGCQDKSIRIIDSREKKVTQKLHDIHENALTCIEYDKNKNLIVSIGIDNKVCLTDLRAGRKIDQFTHSSLEIDFSAAKLSVNENNGLFYVGSSTGDVFLFDTNNFLAPTLLQRVHEAPVFCSASSSEILLTGDSSGTIVCWN